VTYFQYRWLPTWVNDFLASRSITLLGFGLDRCLPTLNDTTPSQLPEALILHATTLIIRSPCPTAITIPYRPKAQITGISR
jgi:hypothetical protein